MTVQEYMRRMGREKLEDMLREYCEGADNLYPEMALIICDVLSDFDPSKPNVYDAFRNLCAIYLP